MQNTPEQAAEQIDQQRIERKERDPTGFLVIKFGDRDKVAAIPLVQTVQTIVHESIDDRTVIRFRKFNTPKRVRIMILE